MIILLLLLLWLLSWIIIGIGIVMILACPPLIIIVLSVLVGIALIGIE